MNKVKYILVNGDTAIGIVYESDKYGRTLVLEKPLDSNWPLQIFEQGKTDGPILDMDLMEFIHSLLPAR
jgi:hypothetical protein